MTSGLDDLVSLQTLGFSVFVRPSVDVGRLLGGELTARLRGPPGQVRLQDMGDTLLLSQSQP